MAGAEADLGGELVADETDQAGGGEQPEVLERARMDEALNLWTSATSALTKMARTTVRPASRSPRRLRKKKASPSGIAVRASPKLWIRSAPREHQGVPASARA